MKKSELIWALCEVDEDLVLMAKENSSMKKTRMPHRLVLIAAIVALFAITAAAIGYSMHMDARTDLGISESNMISEYTEYEVEEPAEVSQQVSLAPDDETGMISGGETQLVSTFCSGNEVIAYISVPNVTAEMAEGVENWDITNTDGDYIVSYLPVEQVSFDENTQTALVKVSVTGDFTEVECINLSVIYREWFAETFTLYDTVEIPVTTWNCLRTEVGRPLECTEVEFDATIVEAEVYAGYVSLYLQTPSFTELRNMLGEDADEILWELQYGEGPVEPENVDVCYDGLISRMMNDYETYPFGDMLDVSLNLADGTTVVLSELERPYANVWTNPDPEHTGYHKTGLWEYQCVLSKPLNLADIISITICGDTYELSAK